MRMEERLTQITPYANQLVISEHRNPVFLIPRRFSSYFLTKKTKKQKHFNDFLLSLLVYKKIYIFLRLKKMINLDF